MQNDLKTEQQYRLEDPAFIEALDPGIRDAVITLIAGGIETFESCQGGEGHSFPEPTIRFHGEKEEGYRAVAWALQHGLKVGDLRRVWHVIEGELTGPIWEITFFERAPRIEITGLEFEVVNEQDI